MGKPVNFPQVLDKHCEKEYFYGEKTKGSVPVTQYERALAGKLFDAHSRELIEKKHRTHVLCQKYNLTAEDDPDRPRLIREIAGNLFPGPHSV